MSLYLINGTERVKINNILDGEVSEALTGEQQISVKVFGSIAAAIKSGSMIEFAGQYYDVASFDKSGNSTEIICTVNCEHISYRLSLAKYDVESFSFGGSYFDFLSRILVDTEFVVGDVPEGNITGFVVEGASRRELLNAAAESIGCEITYDGYAINFVEHRGSTVIKDLMDANQVTGISANVNLTGGGTSYNITLGKRGDLNCGDEIHIVYAPLDLDVNTRIIAIRYNPYNEYICSIDVGDYIPDIVDAYTDLTRRVLLKADASIEFEKYINSAEGTAALSAVLSGTYVTTDALGDYVQTSELYAEVEAYLNGAEGQASIISAVSGKFMEKQPDAVFSTPSGATYGFSLTSDGYYTSTNTGISSSYAYGKITFNTTEATTITLECVSYGESNYDYGIISAINSELAMNNSADSSNVLKSFKGLSSISPAKITLDIPAGESYITFKYIKDGSGNSFGDYFKIKVKGTQYATLSEVGASIEQTVNAFEASITLTASTSGNKSTLTLKSGSTTLTSADITFTGFVTFNDLSTKGSTSINGANITTGTISAERIDTSTLRAQKVYYYDGVNYYPIVQAAVSGQNTYTEIGPKDLTNGYAQYLALYGSTIFFCDVGETPGTGGIGVYNGYEIHPISAGEGSVGTADYYFYEMYSQYYCFRYGGQLYETSSALRYRDPDGTSHTLVSY